MRSNDAIADGAQIGRTLLREALEYCTMAANSRDRTANEASAGRAGPMPRREGVLALGYAAGTLAATARWTGATSRPRGRAGISHDAAEKYLHLCRERRRVDEDA